MQCKEKKINMSSKLNCWEFKKCGREPFGANVDKLGVCLTATYAEFNGLNGGKNGGRVCWAIPGTLCNSNAGESLEEKQRTCMSCDFYKAVAEEELVTETVS